MFKDTKFTERATLQFRMDFFNVFNHVQFLGNAQGATFVNNTIDTNPGATLCANLLTVCSYTPNPGYGVATKDKGPREIQYGLKLTF